MQDLKLEMEMGGVTEKFPIWTNDVAAFFLPFPPENARMPYES